MILRLEQTRVRVAYMDKINAMKLETCAFRGIAMGLVALPEMYCQSKQIESRPSPSFPLEPPKIRVKSGDR